MSRIKDKSIEPKDYCTNLENGVDPEFRVFFSLNTLDKGTKDEYHMLTISIPGVSLEINISLEEMESILTKMKEEI